MDVEIEGLVDLQEIARGATATIYSAYQAALDRRVAVKVLADAGEETWDRLNREARAIGRLAVHPNIVPLYDVGQTKDGRPYLLMPLYTGGSLADLLQNRGTISTEEVLRVGVQLAAALASAHSVGVVHGDVKPSNVLLTGRQDVVLSDFGVARVAGKAGTSSEPFRGTLAYASPEMIEGHQPQPASDVFALSATLVSAATGRSPFVTGEDDSVMAILQRIVAGELSIGREVDEPLRDVLVSALARDPGQRPSAVELGNQLRMIQRQAGLTVTDMPVPGLERADVDERARSVFASVMAPPSDTGTIPLSAIQGEVSAAQDSSTLPPPEPVPMTAPPSAPTAPPPPTPVPMTAKAPAPRAVRRWQRYPAAVLRLVILVVTAPVVLARKLAGWVKGARPSRKVPESPGQESLATLTADRPTSIDHLRRAPLVKGLARVLNDPGTSLPMTVGIFGQWGSGKSSLMLQLEGELRRADPPATGRDWTPVWFDAWRYQGRDRLWAGLARAIYVQGSAAQGSWWRRAALRVAVERRRKGAALLAVAALVGLVAAGWLLVSVARALTESGWSPVAGVAAASGVISVAIAYLGIVSDPFTRVLRGGSFRRRYDTALGLTDEAERDIAHLVDALASRRDNGAVIVFLDDLDRCEPAVIAEALTSVSEVFGRHEGERIVFVLGVDIDLVESAIEGSLGDVRETLQRINPQRTTNLGARFLERIFQLSISLETFRQPPVELLLGGSDGSGEEPDDADVRPYLEGLFALDVEEPAELTAVRQSSGFETHDVDPQELLAFRAAIRERRAPLLSGLSRQVREAERLVVSQMTLTPRAVKRFDNTFRLQLQVANSTPGSLLGFEVEDLTALAKWTALRLFFPQLTRLADREVGLWNELESLASGEEGDSRLQERLARLDGGRQGSVTPDIAFVLSAGLPAAPLARLPLDSFATVV